MYNVNQITSGIQNPNIIKRKLISTYSNLRYEYFPSTLGDYIVEKDWDNLIILDACRYDTFEQCNTIQGKLGSFNSRASSTGSFVRQNFGDGPYHDIVYISANPNPANHEGVQSTYFADVKEVYDTGWDDDLHTVPPDEMVKRTIEAELSYPNKRLISHFLQPHYPWIGSEGREFIQKHGVVWDWGNNKHI
jgi:predicted nucleotidyltransferase